MVALAAFHSRGSSSAPAGPWGCSKVGLAQICSQAWHSARADGRTPHWPHVSRAAAALQLSHGPPNHSKAGGSQILAGKWAFPPYSIKHLSKMGPCGLPKPCIRARQALPGLGRVERPELVLPDSNQKGKKVFLGFLILKCISTEACSAFSVF